jgi:negative regulator of flagellin synthesis FlgM
MTDPIRGALGGNPPGEINPTGGTNNDKAASDATTTVSGTAGADYANVGQTRSLLETINATVAGVPTVNQSRVDALRQAIQNGTYQIDPQRIAKGLINADSALPALTKE